MKWLAMMLLFAGVSLLSAQAPAFGSWGAEKIRQLAKELAGRLSPEGFAGQKLADMGNYNFALVLRTQSGTAEMHQKAADILVIERGEADLVTGGTIVNPKNESPIEIRGSAIENGAVHHVAAGDVLTIPAGMPHQMQVASGKEVLYMAIKVLQ